MPVLYLLERFCGPERKEEKDLSEVLTCQKCITCRCYGRKGGKKTAPAQGPAKSGFKWEQTAGKSAEELEVPKKTASAEQRRASISTSNRRYCCWMTSPSLPPPIREEEEQTEDKEEQEEQ